MKHRLAAPGSWAIGNDKTKRTHSLEIQERFEWGVAHFTKVKFKNLTLPSGQLGLDFKNGLVYSNTQLPKEDGWR